MDKQAIDDALEAARLAVEYDTREEYKQAIYYYAAAVKHLQTIQNPSLSEKAAEYQERIDNLQQILSDEEKDSSDQLDESELEKCKLLLNQALDADEAGDRENALKLYTEAAELGINAKPTNTEIKAKLTNLVRSALDRAEAIKGINRKKIETSALNLPSVPETDLPNETSIPSITETSPVQQSKPSLHRGDSAHLKVVGGNAEYTDEEKKVLLHSSKINDNEFVPFMNIDLTERFKYPISFTDKDGLLELSPKQKPDFARWCRPEELFSDPKMIIGNHIDYYSIKQTVVSDCSFVASLAVSAQYERKFGRKLVTEIIYPRNRDKTPIYNPFGKYMIKLHINGIPRKVIIDDYLPVSRHNHLLCSYSNKRGELWISLLEKAYMKVMGGYDFPGSNSNIDLHALTGWIPERWAIRLNEPDFNKDHLFDTLFLKLHRGDILVTVATGELSDAEADRTGLVPTHAYAVLDVRKINGETRLLQLKNPWSHLRWKGNFSELDRNHWTSSLQEALNYDPDSASQFDNGIFWIDYDSICRFFDVFYINWNPGLFKYTYCIHQMWRAGIGPIRDAYNIGDNPQFSLEVLPNAQGAVWILLTRHITDIADFRQNQEYISVLVYKNSGKRVYYPHDPPPYIDGVRINSPHYLCKIKLGPNSDNKYTLVISQYEKTNTIYYTLRAYGTCPFKLRKIADPYRHMKEITNGEWKGITAGGCGNHPATYQNNPRYQLQLESSHNNNYLLIILKGPKQYQIGFEIVSVSLNDQESPSAFNSKSSGLFRCGFVYLELEDVPGGTYNIIPSTYLPNQEGPFFLTCKSSCNIQLGLIQ
ncbi:calpain-7-like [Leptopilina heterotoma]|uniref:calpain-7-like n=1 Tax=Leptopilina heterotoma TaxID=63436 RepID=UPI001CA8E1F5|nr:calpain-7-like [Leptopilina heterotoma]XP_043462565.1 calpain-7-like [Leptopilina heterotoma]